MVKAKKQVTTTDRVSTGIPGFDKLLNGGFPRRRVVLLSGSPGTGKTIFGLQFLYNGAKLFNEKGLFVSIEQNIDELKTQAKQFGWDFDKLEKTGKIKFMRLHPNDIQSTTAKDIAKYTMEHNYRRLVLDSLTGLAVNTPNIFFNNKELHANIQRFMYTFINDLKVDHMTSLLISQTLGDELSRDKVSEFVADGVVNIKYESMGSGYSRALIIRKMRETKHNEDIHPLEICSKGIRIHSL